MRPWNTPLVVAALAAVTLTAQTNRAPVAHAQFRQVLEDAPIAIALTASDADSDPLSFTVVDSPAHGTLSGMAPNVVYTPDDDYNGPDSFTFTAHDGDDGSNVARVDLSVGPTLWKTTGLYGGHVELLRTDPTLPGVVYAGTSSGLFKSIDGGATWSATGTGLSYQPLADVAIDPTATSTLYAATSSGQLFKSVDGGASWILVHSMTFTAHRAVAVDPLNPSTVHALANSLFGPSDLMTSLDGGLNWPTQSSTGISSPTALVLDPVTPSTLYVTGSNGIAKSINGGSTWTPVNDGLSNLNVLGLAIDPTAPATLLVSTNSGVFKSTNGGTSWNPTSAPLGGWDLVMDPSSPSTLYLGTLSGGVYKTIDGGDTWQPSNAGFPSATIYALAIDRGTPSSIYASPGQMDVGVIKSVDAGATWTAGGLTGLMNAWASGLAVDPGTSILASGNGRILKRLHAGGAWTNLNASGPVPGTLLADPADPLTYYGLSGNGVSKSTNGALTWSPANTGLPFSTLGSVSALAIDPVASGTLYVGFATSVSSATIYKTTDGGANWSPSGTGLPTPAFPPLWVNSIAVDPVTPNRVYAGTTYGVYVSINSGASWSRPDTAPGDIQAFAIDPAVPTTVYAGTDTGVLKSVDGGLTWTPAGNGLPGPIRMMAIAPGGTGILYAANYTEVYRSLNGGRSWISVSAGLLDRTLLALTIDPLTHAVYAGTRNGVFELQQVPWTTPDVSWTAPADITYGTPLGSAQLNATAEIPGTFTYTPAAGTVLDVGNAQTLSVTFTPTDAAHYADGTASVPINVIAAESTTTLFAFPTSVSFLQPVYLIAAVNPVAPGTGVVQGVVEFMDGATSLGTASLSNGFAVLAANGLASGTHIITASYAGSSRFNGSGSDPVGVSVDSLAESTFTLLIPATNPQAVGQQTVLVAAVLPIAGTGEPTGTVQFVDGNTVIGTAPVTDGFAIFTTTTLAPGPHLIGARYLGDGTFTPSTAPPTVQTIYSGARPATTTTSLSQSSSTSVPGEPVTFTATVTTSGAAPTGPVIFFGDGLLLGVAPVTNTGGAFRGSVVLSNLPAGIHVITASYVGGPGTAASNSLPAIHAVQSTGLAGTTLGTSSGSTALQRLLRAVQLAKGAAVLKR